MQTFWSLAFSKRIVLNAIKVALVIGTILNIINQGGAFLGALHLAWGGGLLVPVRIAWGHVALNYVTPYLVATWSAVKNELDRRRDK